MCQQRQGTSERDGINCNTMLALKITEMMRNPSVTIRINTSCSENMHLKVYDYKGLCPPAVLRLFWIDNGVCNETFTISEKAPSRASSRHEIEMPTQSSYGTGLVSIDSSSYCQL